MREPRFVADVNVGKLAKWLRAMGYDVLFPIDVEDNELVRIALREDRVIVTRDRGIMERRLVTSGRLEAVLVRDDDLKGQLRQVVRALGLSSGREFSRCIRCNEVLLSIPKELAEERVPPYVYETQKVFMECPICNKVYWRGTHWANMQRELTQLQDGEGEP